MAGGSDSDRFTCAINQAMKALAVDKWRCGDSSLLPMRSFGIDLPETFDRA
jgi:hypothetical protein